MDFIKKLFDGADGLTYEAFMQKANEAGIKFANLSEGNYVSKKKYEDDLSAKDTQIADLNTTISTRDSDLASIKQQLEQAGADQTKLAQLSSDMTNLQSKYDNDVKQYKSKLAKQAYEFAVKEFANSKKFTSNAAKRDFVNSMIAKELKMDNDKILGADDFVTAYSADNADAFVVETPAPDPTPQPPKPKFVDPTSGPDPSSGNEFAFNFTGVRAKE